MLDLATYFGLGNAAILTNACMLPLYPGMIAFLAGNANDERHRRATGWLGLLVLAGVLTMMVIIGVILYLVQLALGDALMILLPLIYAVVIVLGILMLMGRNPFARLATAQLPLMKNPYVAAYVYGLLFGPMTLPCTGPIITGALLVGAGSAPMLGASLANFVAFGIGFGWPLALLPLIALPVQRRLVRWLGTHHRVLERVSGLLLIAVGVFGVITELLPHVMPNFATDTPFWWAYWVLVAVGIVVVAWRGLGGK
jgi:cytochrome c-type biogenesis protein